MITSRCSHKALVSTTLQDATQSLSTAQQSHEDSFTTNVSITHGNTLKTERYISDSTIYAGLLRGRTHTQVSGYRIAARVIPSPTNFFQKDCELVLGQEQFNDSGLLTTAEEDYRSR